MLRPFWYYYGGKWRAAPRYPAPRHDLIIEPFAGAAGYAMRYPDRDVLLIEKYPVVAEIWRYLISADPEQIRATPTDIDSIDELPSWVPAGLRSLIGFSMNHAAASPRKTLSAGRRRLRAAGRASEGWSHKMRERVASQVPQIRHWQIWETSYATIDVFNPQATWFIDPPYQRAGSHYVHGSSVIDFAHLATWCQSRQGQVVVCEAAGAAWLPFRPFAEIRSFGAGGLRQKSAEVIWTNDGEVRS